MSAESAKVLRDAADILERDGWCQGKLHKENPASPSRYSHCAVGALYEVSCERTALIAAHQALADYVDPSEGLWVGRWNNVPGRTAADVIKTLREVADAEDFR